MCRLVTSTRTFCLNHYIHTYYTDNLLYIHTVKTQLFYFDNFGSSNVNKCMINILYIFFLFMYIYDFFCTFTYIYVLIRSIIDFRVQDMYIVSILRMKYMNSENPMRYSLASV